MLKRLRFAALVAAALLLQSCFFAPGKFTSTLELRRGGQFTFAYQGEVRFIDEWGAGGLRPSMPDRCWGPVPKAGESANPIVIETVDPENPEASTPVRARDCTPAEQAAHKAQYEKHKREQAMAMVAIFGFNPYDPASIQTFIIELKKYRGWRSVVHKGDNRFEIDYRISGSLAQDITFPVFDGVVIHTPFVVIRPRNDGGVDVRAPAFGGGPGGWAGLTGIGGGPRAITPAPAGVEQMLEAVDGTFTIVTDGDIRTNNTSEGAIARGADKVLTWRVNNLSKEAPRALVGL